MARRAASPSPQPRMTEVEDDMAYAPPAYRRVLCRDLEALEADLARTARMGGRFPWVERLRDRVRAVRERLQREPRQA